MKLYHASPIENLDSISEVGVFPTDCGTKAHNGDSLQKRGLTGIYGFVSLDDAISFTQDNGSEGYVIFAFDVDENVETIFDPEYEGESIFVVTDEPMQAVKVWEA
jgi:hypothetical protein